MPSSSSSPSNNTPETPDSSRSVPSSGTKLNNLQTTWNGEYFSLWVSRHALTPSAPLYSHSVDDGGLEILISILEDQELVSYERGSFQLSALPNYSGDNQTSIINTSAFERESASFIIDKSIRISAAGFVDLFSSFGSELEDGYVFAPSTRFWIHGAKLLLSCLARGLFYPCISRRGAVLEAIWELIEIDDDFQEKVRELSDAMPGISAEILPSVVGNEDYRHVGLRIFLQKGVDGILRSFLSSVNLIEGIEKTASGFQTARGAIPRRDAMVLLWLTRLVDKDNSLSLTALEQTLLEQKIKDWNSPLRRSRQIEKEFLQLEIIPPFVQNPGEAMELPWTVEMKLCSSKKSEDNEELNESHEGTSGEEHDFLLLKEIGRIFPVVPYLYRALEKNFSHKVQVSAEEAHQLLTRYQPILKEIGVSIKAPSWWEESASAVGLVVKLKPRGGVTDEEPNIFSSSSLVDFSWSLTVGESELSLEEFEALLEEGRSLLYVGNQWVSFNNAKIKKSIEELKIKSPQRSFTLFDALRLGLGGISGLSDLEVVRVDSQGWIRKILDYGSISEVDQKLPESFKGVLRPYQSLGVSWLFFLSKIGIGGCLADDMGLGKTIQVLALLAKEKEARNKSTPHQPNLLIVPMSILGNWEAEAKKFVPELDVYIHHGSFRESGANFQKSVIGKDLIVTTYSIVHRDYKSFRKIPWYRIILDEAQNIKNVDTKQTKAVRSLVEELSRSDVFISGSPDSSVNQKSETLKHEQVVNQKLPSGPLRLALTGTPLENRLQELWSILDFLNPGLLGSLDEFRKRYVNPIEKSRETEAANQLGRLIKPFVLRRTKQDPEIAAELPEKIEMESLVPLTPEQASLYAATLEQMMPKVREAEGIHRKGLVLSVITKLKQICVHPSLVLKDDRPLTGRSGKLQLLEELLETILDQGDRTLVFTQFAQWGHLLAPYLASRFDTTVPFFHGGLNRASREDIVRDFQSEQGPRLLVLSLKAGGFGLNLTRANQVIHIDQWWNPAIQNQATDRAYRIGQRSNVQVRTLISRGTLEEKINMLHKEKLELAQTIVGTTRNVITELSADALEDLLQLQTTLITDSV
ncbi:MAG TPA: SNF2-related protein [Oligoflexia bacterium]|nr:SNF2-related protein [Oligoflexia bacterium]HMP49731.1 SNF2-related protein [Oligoflexia bacterium]